MSSAVSTDRIEAAMGVISPEFLRSPQFVSDALSSRLGVSLLCKVECLNPIRSFKGRGTDHLLHVLGDSTETLVAASAVNFGQGLAYAGRARKVPVVIFASQHANPLKVERMRALGAEVRIAGEDFDAAKAAARAFAISQGWRYIEDGREPAINEGAGTIGLELAEWSQPINTLLVPIGNGALIAGVGAWFKAVSPHTRIIGVVASQAPSMQWSWQQRRVVTTPTADTIADGIAVREPIVEALDAMRPVIDDIVAVSEAELLDAMRLAYDELGILVEPAGAAGLAAVLQLRESLRDQLAATILCGGNVTREEAAKWFGD